MDISVLISSNKHPVNANLNEWIKAERPNHVVKVFHSKDDLVAGYILFLISSNEIILKLVRNLFHKTLVLHTSDLPKGKGWSPNLWEIINV